ncbi:MAG: hypothetical protein ACNA8J_11460, partial [Gammaproteobacteria bacterium]
MACGARVGVVARRVACGVRVTVAPDLGVAWNRVACDVLAGALSRCWIDADVASLDRCGVVCRELDWRGALAVGAGVV